MTDPLADGPPAIPGGARTGARMGPSWPRGTPQRISTIAEGVALVAAAVAIAAKGRQGAAVDHLVGRS